MKKSFLIAKIGLATGLVLALAAGAQTIDEFQPAVKWHGRAVAVTVESANTDQAIVASESGGLFKTENHGGSWLHLDNLPMFRMRDVKYGPLLPGGGRVVIATGWADSRVVNGGGIWRSTDGGLTWAKPATSNPGCSGRAGAWGISFEPGSANVYVGTDCGLAVSTDYGATWTHLSPAPPFDPRIFGVVAHDPAGLSGAIVDVCGPAGHLRSTNGGGTFTATGSQAGEATPHCIAVSPVESGVVYVANAMFIPTNGFCGAMGGWAATLLEGVYGPGGDITWREVISRRCRGGGRASWVATNPSRDGNADHFDIYFGTGLSVFRQTVTTKGGSGPRCNRLEWTFVSVDHADQNGMAFSTANNCAQFIVSDGGVHRPTDEADPANCGATWEIAGPGNNGYHALQLYEVTGQMSSGPPGSPHVDLYIGTQDNSLWASGNAGLAWPFPVGGEGFHIQAPRYAISHDPQTVTWCDPANGINRKGPAHFAANLAWNNPAGTVIHNPTYIGPRDLGTNIYVQYRPFSDKAVLAITRDSGAIWADVILNPMARASWPQVSVSSVDVSVTLYEPYVRGTTLPSGDASIGLLKITGIRSDGVVSGAKVRLADVSGLGSLAQFCPGEGTFVCPAPFAVDPNDPAHLITADVTDGQMKVSRDGGASWTPDMPLTDLVTGLNPATGSREFRFNIPANQFSRSGPAPGAQLQAHVIAFDPFHLDRILVGTEAAGIFYSTNGGTTWTAIPDSRKVTAISSIFFLDEWSHGNPYPEALIATYGRGLWKVTFSPAEELGPPFLVPPERYLEPCFFTDPVDLVWINPRDFFEHTNCPSCLYDAVLDGNITDISISPEGAVQSFAINGGRVIGSTQDGQPVAPTVPTLTSQTPGNFNGCPGCSNLVQQGGVIKGIVLEGGRLKALIGGFGQFAGENELRQFSSPPPQIPLTPEVTAPVGPYLRLTGTIPAGGQATALAGEAVAASGSGFCGNADCLPVVLSVGDRVVAADVPVDANGNFQASFTLTESPGVYTVTAVQQIPGRQLLAAAGQLNVPVGEAEDIFGRPRLEIRAEGNDLALAWPAAATGYVLEWTTNLSSPNSWQPYPGPVVTVGEENRVSVQPAGMQSFFRLRR